MGQPTEQAVLDWYERAYDEHVRLTHRGHGRLEALRTREIVGRYLGTAPMRVLDVGGGTGAYAGWLAGLGHAVDLVDPVAAHVAAARRLPGVSAEVGDARDLPQTGGGYDLVLALGPLYHLTDRAERVRALGEAARVATPSGVLMAAAIGRYHVLGEFALDTLLSAPQLELLRPVVAEGRNPVTTGFPLRHGHVWDELRDEAVDAGWQEVQVLGVEGPVGHGIDLVAPERLDDAVAQAADVARLVETDPRVIDVSPHLVVIGRAPVTERTT